MNPEINSKNLVANKFLSTIALKRKCNLLHTEIQFWNIFVCLFLGTPDLHRWMNEYPYWDTYSLMFVWKLRGTPQPARGVCHLAGLCLASPAAWVRVQLHLPILSIEWCGDFGSMANGDWTLKVEHTPWIWISMTKRPGVSSDGNFSSYLIRKSGHGWLFLFPVGGIGNDTIYPPK